MRSRNRKIFFFKFGRRHLQRCYPNEKVAAVAPEVGTCSIYSFGMGYLKPLKVEKLLKTWAKR